MKSKFKNLTHIFAGRIAMRIAAAAVLLLPVLAWTVHAQNAPRETVLYSFRGGTDGQSPDAQLIRDAAGNLYGTTQYGGIPTCGQSIGCGTVFKISSSGVETVLYAFTSGTDHSNPTGGVIRDAAGNLYGVASDSSDHNVGGFGSVFRLEPSGKLVTLYAFTGGTDGESPLGRVVRDSAGNLYGTTSFGGGVYKVDPAGHATVLYRFMGGSDGEAPFAPLLRDRAGNLYGTTNQGGGACGGNNGGCGTVFKIDSSGNETVLYRFTDGPDGGYPYAGLIQDRSGNLYGTTDLAGDTSCNPPSGCGTVFKLDTSGSFTVLHTFTGGPTDGANPFGALTSDAAGNLYGTTGAGGDVNCGVISGFSGCGTVFKLDPLGHETLLHIFGESAGDGLVPLAGVVRDDAGDLYGTTNYGGKNTFGTVYRISPR